MEARANRRFGREPAEGRTAAPRQRRSGGDDRKRQREWEEARHGRPRAQRGFTVLELLIALGILALLLGVAVPSFGALRRHADLTAATNQLLWALHFARSSAIRDGIPVTLCLTADDVSCVPSPDSAGRGWLVIGRPAGAVGLSPEPNGEDGQLLHQFRLPAALAVYGSRPAVTFWPASRAGMTSTFDLCEVGERPRGRAVIVSQTGRPRVSAEEASCAP